MCCAGRGRDPLEMLMKKKLQAGSPFDTWGGRRRGDTWQDRRGRRKATCIEGGTENKKAHAIMKRRKSKRYSQASLTPAASAPPKYARTAAKTASFSILKLGR